MLVTNNRVMNIPQSVLWYLVLLISGAVIYIVSDLIGNRAIPYMTSDINAVLGTNTEASSEDESGMSKMPGIRSSVSEDD